MLNEWGIQWENGKQTDASVVNGIPKTKMEGSTHKKRKYKRNKEETISMDFAAPDWTIGIWVQTKSLKYTCSLILCFDRTLPVEQKQMKPKQIISDKEKGREAREKKHTREKCAVRTEIMIIFFFFPFGVFCS